jgi:hypothetical protein
MPCSSESSYYVTIYTGPKTPHMSPGRNTPLSVSAPKARTQLLDSMTRSTQEFDAIAFQVVCLIFQYYRKPPNSNFEPGIESNASTFY